MNDRNVKSAAEPVFKRCVRCGYRLRGLPANHACPECGLRFDERCELYKVTNPKQVVALWLLFLGGGWVSLRNLRHLTNFASVSVWQKVGVLAGVAWVFFVAAGIWFLVRVYRRGQEVAVTTDGLIIRLLGFQDDLIPWADIGEAHIKRPKGKPQIVSLYLKARQKNVDIGGVSTVFPRREDAERFIAQVNERVRMAGGECARQDSNLRSTV